MWRWCLAVFHSGIFNHSNFANHSDVFDRDLFEILLPVLLEANLLLPLWVKLGHYVVKALLEALLKLVIVFVASANDRLVMIRILYLHLARELILDFIPLWTHWRGWWAAWFGHWGGSPTFSIGINVSVRSELLFKVDLENRGAKAGELSCCSLRQISIGIHCHQMLDILMLLFDNFIAR